MQLFRDLEKGCIKSESAVQRYLLGWPVDAAVPLNIRLWWHRACYFVSI
jgi:hypothetical protein